MGFLSSLFGRDWKSFKKRGDKFLGNDEIGRARGEYLEALKRYDGSDEAQRESLEAAVAGVNKRLYDKHRAEAERHREAGSQGKAIEFFRLALDFAPDHETRDAILDAIANLENTVADAIEAEAEDTRGTLAPQQSDVDEDFEIPEEDEEEAFVALLAALPDGQADLYESLGDQFRRGYIALMQGRLQTASVELEPLLEEQPDSAYLQYEVGRLRLAQGRYADAEELLTIACEGAPDMVALRHARIEALWGVEDWEQAERVVEEAFEIDDELLDNFVYAGRTCLQSGEFDNGAEILEAGLELHERSIVLFRLLGKLKAAAGKHGGALDAFESALALRWQYNPETEAIYLDNESAFLAGNIYLQVQRSDSDVKRADELFRALLNTEDQSSRWAYLYGLAKATDQLGDREQARSMLVDAAALVPEESEAREQIDEALEKLLAPPPA